MLVLLVYLQTWW